MYEVNSSLILVWPFWAGIPECLPNKVVNCVVLCNCLCVNVCCTSPTGCQPNCSYQIYHIICLIWRMIPIVAMFVMFYLRIVSLAYFKVYLQTQFHMPKSKVSLTFATKSYLMKFFARQPYCILNCPKMYLDISCTFS